MAAVAEYQLDPVHTRVMFAVEHAGFSHALGTVSGSTGTLAFDPDDWSTASLRVSVPLRHADLGDEKWNQAVQARNLLDVERFPTATFVSTQVEGIDPQHAVVTGDLTLHGVTHQVQLQVTLNALKRHPLPPFRRTAGFSASTTLSRAEFGITAWKSVIGDSVEVRLEVEATRAPADGNDGEGQDQDNVGNDHQGSDAIDTSQPIPSPAPETKP